MEMVQCCLVWNLLQDLAALEIVQEDLQLEDGMDTIPDAPSHKTVLAYEMVLL